MNSNLDLPYRSAEKQAVRSALLAWGMTPLGVIQFLSGDLVLLKRDRAVIDAMLSMYVASPASAQLGKPNPGKMNFEHYYDRG